MIRKEILVLNGSSGEKGIIDSIFKMLMKILVLSGLPDDEITAQVAYCKAFEFFGKMKSDIINKGISKEIMKIISAKNKADAKKACKGRGIKDVEFADFIYLAQREGYSHEVRTKEFLPDGIKEEELPTIIQFDNKENLYYEGHTKLSKKQMISIIRNRKKIHAHFFEKKNELHCFYFTFSDIKGDHWGTPHLHYVSHLWTYKKQEVLDALFDSRRHKQVGDHVKYVLSERPSGPLEVPRFDQL